MSSFCVANLVVRSDMGVGVPTDLSERTMVANGRNGSERESFGELGLCGEHENLERLAIGNHALFRDPSMAKTWTGSVCRKRSSGIAQLP